MSEPEVTAQRSTSEEKPTEDHAPNVDGTPRTPGRWRRRWQRISHIYRTRVRTTTVLLVVVWVASLILYLFSANHYGTLPNATDQQERPVVTSSTIEHPEAVAPSTTGSVPATGSESQLHSGNESSSPTSSPESTPSRGATAGTGSPGATVAPTGAPTTSPTR
ncbi:MAG: hypothetical protein WAW85_01330 [Gordonia sp. (in: high G+C Gram-positive bacteria)]|uniref:hypothetical protein n=1 Tax=Gordonia sp. (in: high G+C Gram-positive bacteria) TaxID=84139 RepID=UPI003BB7C858